MRINRQKLASRVVLFATVLNAVGGIVVVIFLLYLILNPSNPVSKNIIETIAKAVEIPVALAGPSGQPGVDGIDGDDGSDGRDGQPGPQGPQGSQGPQGATGPQGVQGNDAVPIQGEKGDKGDRGEPGQPGPRADFRCNPDTSRREYMYPGDEEWTSTNEMCVAALGE